MYIYIFIFISIDGYSYANICNYENRKLNGSADWLSIIIFSGHLL